MKTRLLHYLICPKCKSENNVFDLHIFSESKASSKTPKEVKDGVLLCACGQWYPISNFIPRMTIGTIRGPNSDFMKTYKNRLYKILKFSSAGPRKISVLSNSKYQVKESFSYKWGLKTTYSKNMAEFSENWFMKKLGISDKKKLDHYFKGMKSVLDAGTGLGAKVGIIAKRSSADVIGVDLSGTDHAFRNNRGYSNTHIVEADIFDLPFRKGAFDCIISDGVLHHTPDTKKAFNFLVPLLKKQGRLSIHVYKKMGPIREFTDDYLRGVATKLSATDCYEFSKPFTSLGKALHEARLKIKIPQDIPELQIKKGTYDLQRFIYYIGFQCFWNPLFSFKQNNIINFDWFHPADAARHTEEEVLGWFNKAHFKKVFKYQTSLSGVSVVGVK